MKIFLSYASQDRAIADSINHALLDQGHDVFFDRDDLSPGEEYHNTIRAAIERAELFVFLISEYAIDPGSYTLNELDIAEECIKAVSGRLLPVMLRPMPLDKIPTFAKTVTLLESPGNITAATADAVYRISQRRQRALLTKVGAALAVCLILGGVWAVRASSRRVATPTTPTTTSATAADSVTSATTLKANGDTIGAPILGIDGAQQVLIPAGTFVMGDDEESPKRKIYLDAFFIDRDEVTTGRYAKFLAATGSVRPPEDWEALKLPKGINLPVVGVDWNDAAAYCTWAGRRLPTDAEWEKAARGTDERMYPWGDEQPTTARANFENASPEPYDGGLTDVGTHPDGQSPFGVQDLAGNANEWTADWFSERFASGDLRNPKGPTSGNGRVIRGGGRYEPADRMLSTKRYHAAPDTRGGDIGFRCARTP